MSREEFDPKTKRAAEVVFESILKGMEKTNKRGLIQTKLRRIVAQLKEENAATRRKEE